MVRKAEEDEEEEEEEDELRDFHLWFLHDDVSKNVDLYLNGKKSRRRRRRRRRS